METVRTENVISARNLTEVRRGRQPENTSSMVRNKKTRKVFVCWIQVHLVH